MAPSAGLKPVISGGEMSFQTTGWPAAAGKETVAAAAPELVYPDAAADWRAAGPPGGAPGPLPYDSCTAPPGPAKICTGVTVANNMMVNASVSSHAAMCLETFNRISSFSLVARGSRRASLEEGLILPECRRRQGADRWCRRRCKYNRGKGLEL